MRKRGGIPGNKITIRLLEVRHTGRLERAAEGIARFEQRDIMAAQRAHARRLQAGRPAADNDHALFLRCGRDADEPLARALGVDRAGADRAVKRAAEAALVAAQARTDERELVVAHLADVVRLGQERTRQTDHVAAAVSQRLRRQIRIVHASGSQHRHVHDLLDLLGKRQIDALVKVHRRMRPVPAIVGAGIDIERVVARHRPGSWPPAGPRPNRGRAR